MARLYTSRHIASVLLHYGMATGIAALSYTFAQPWTIMAAAALTLGIAHTTLRANKRIFENNLERYGDSHKDAKTLGALARQLYKSSGLKSDQFPIYNFRIAEPLGKEGEENSFKETLRRVIEVILHRNLGSGLIN